MTAVESLERIRRDESLDSGLNAFVSLAAETAVGSRAEAGGGMLQRRRALSRTGPLL